MKPLTQASLLMFSILLCFTFCHTKHAKSNNLNPVEQMPIYTNNDSITTDKVKVKIGTSTFTVTLLDNPTAKAFKALLPLSLKMNELNDNEKYAQLPKSVPTNSASALPTSIKSGDLMMYGSSTLVLFYKSFNTTYSYTKLGKIENINGLLEALGNGNVKVSFEINK